MPRNALRHMPFGETAVVKSCHLKSYGKKYAITFAYDVVNLMMIKVFSPNFYVLDDWFTGLNLAQ